MHFRGLHYKICCLFKIRHTKDTMDKYHLRPNIVKSGMIYANRGGLQSLSGNESTDNLVMQLYERSPASDRRSFIERTCEDSALLNIVHDFQVEDGTRYNQETSIVICNENLSTQPTEQKDTASSKTLLTKDNNETEDKTAKMRAAMQRRRNRRRNRRRKKGRKSNKKGSNKSSSGGGGGGGMGGGEYGEDPLDVISETMLSLLHFVVKDRIDSADEQFSRIFLVKVLMVSSLVLCLQYYCNKVYCTSPAQRNFDLEFVHTACWINGVYVYNELGSRLNDTNYYGMPRDVEIDGVKEDGQLCRRLNKTNQLYDKACQPFKRTYYFHYQYFPFYIGSLALICYMPHLFTRIFNDDIVQLRESMKQNNNVTAECIVDNYFDYNSNGGIKLLHLKEVGTVMIKCLYFIVNGLTFLLTDYILYKKYLSYGYDWIMWHKKNLSTRFSNRYDSFRRAPGNSLLPLMGFCDVEEGKQDQIKTLINTHKVTCEISSHHYYQYILLLLWFVFVTGLIISLASLLLCITSMLTTLFCHIFQTVEKKDKFSAICRDLTMREVKYIKIIRRLNNTLFEQVVQLIEHRKQVMQLTIQNPFSGNKLSQFQDDISELVDFLECNKYFHCTQL